MSSLREFHLQTTALPVIKKKASKNKSPKPAIGYLKQHAYTKRSEI